MKTKDLLCILKNYCDDIRYNGKHYICYPKGIKEVIVVSSSSSDRNYHTQVFRDFRRKGIVIKEIKK